MAKIFKKDDSLKNKYHLYCKLILVGGGLFCGGILAVLLNLAFQIMVPALFAVGGICCFSALVMISILGSKTSALKVGISGEKAVAELVERFPDSYYGIQNLVVSFEGKQSELDMVLIGPTGVFIIEAKRRNGRISGNYDAKYWTQHKIGRGGTPYSSDFYSPIKQVGTHVYRLANYLKEQGARVNIEGAVYFSGAEEGFYLSGTPGRIPVFTSTPEGVNALYKFILSGKTELSKDNVNALLKILMKG